jgi:CCR4-NOT transcription complex subunit 1
VATDQTERIVEPPENIQEKIAFIFNNLSQSNMTQKVSYEAYKYRLLFP